MNLERVPAANLVDSQLGQFLRSCIVGQNEAIEAVCRMYYRAEYGLNEANKPLGSLLFLGPTGVGKTELVEVFAEYLFGPGETPLHIDCAEFQHSHEISKLIGSPPGYLGHRETTPYLGKMNVEIREDKKKQKRNILLFDEIDKASDALYKLMLGILDKARVTTGDNATTDFSQTFIIMTSNFGSEELIREHELGFTKDRRTFHDIRRTAEQAARKKLLPEFFNRLDAVVVFHPLEKPQLYDILRLEMNKTAQRLFRSTGIFPKLVPGAEEYLMQDGYDVRYGARHLRRSIERNIVQPITSALVAGTLAKDSDVYVSRDGDGLVIKKKKRSAAAGGDAA